MSKRWSDRDKVVLAMTAGGVPIADISSALSVPRRPEALRAALRREIGGGICRGTRSLSRVCKDTGYSRSQLFRARDDLGQTWSRTADGGRWLLDEETVSALCEKLKHDRWCKKLNLKACCGCGRDDVSHHTRGLCRRCYCASARELRRMNLPTKKALLCDALEKERLKVLPSCLIYVEQCVAAVSSGLLPNRRQIMQLRMARMVSA